VTEQTERGREGGRTGSILRSILPALIVLLLLAFGRDAAALGDPQALAPLFAGLEGAFVVCDDGGEMCTRYNPDLAAERFPPFATVDIVLTLIGLDTGAIPGPDIAVIREKEPEPDDDASGGIAEPQLDLRTAFGQSAAWYFDEVTGRVGRERVAATLADIGYGNADMAGAVDPAQFEDRLRISPDEQVALTGRLLRGDLPFSPSTVAVLEDVAVVERSEDFVLRGRLGAGPGGEGRHVWFVGWLETDVGRYPCATFLKVDNPDAPADQGLAMTLAALRRTGVLPGG
jgi:beta-lactamase class D